MFAVFKNVSSRSQRALLVLSAMSIVIGAIALVVGVVFEKPPSNADPKWGDIYPFFAVFSYISLGGGAFLMIANILSIVSLLNWFHVLFIVQIIVSSLNVVLGIVGGTIALLGSILISVVCQSVGNQCVPCRSDDIQLCDEIAAAHGKGCFYNANDFEVLGSMKSRLLLVAVCLLLGFMLSFTISVMGCITCKRMKYTHAYTHVHKLEEF